MKKIKKKPAFLLETQNNSLRLHQECLDDTSTQAKNNDLYQWLQPFLVSVSYFFKCIFAITN